ncbi:L-lysine 2,3-aminomutase [Symmachiella macrocystis]|uniref:L-lysine 2,3-aminomutase n=1 Tax=Symmachiella macrocystis TaxID=2527985 RepID=A0A5C6BK50_9PLAN|nr:EF-P beta-lysylation protein EpmB [Symmachiella macrocystis]TWU12458.1 L-lysine 2,3-aminomutase [Symmachiella macrocystis]
MPTPHATTRQTLSPQEDTANWHRALAAAVRDPDELIDLLGLGDVYREPARRAAGLFPLLVPRDYLARIEPGNPRDPLLLQVLPLANEEAVVDGFSADAVGDAQAHRSPGLLQKYTGRALLITTGACAVHCRYCFRREFPYGEEPRTMEDWEPAFADIAADSSLHEIILSGGDPLMLTDARLAMFIERLDRIEHLRRLRIHTRLPIVLPQRVTDTLLEMLTTMRLTPIVVMHANHAHELQGDCAAALRELVRGGVTVLNQAVLLRDINDTTESQAELCERLVNLGVIPYYLHQLDRVSGAAHFEVPEQTGGGIIEELRKRLPGYAVPQFVREIAGELHKTPL